MLEEIKELVAESLGTDVEELTEETSFSDDLNADSLDLFELVVSLEEEYGIEIPSGDLEKVETVNDIVEYLEAKGLEG